MDSTKIFVAGDLSIHPDSGPPYLKPQLKKIQSGADIGFVNLESPLKNPQAQEVLKSGPAIFSHPQTPAFLSTHNLRLVSLANNHIMDYSWKSAQLTQRKLNLLKIKSVGIGNELITSQQPVRFSIKRQRFSLFAFADPEFGYATLTSPGYSWTTGYLPQIAREAKSNRTILVSLHGGPEEVLVPSPRQIKHCRALVDAGARVVICHHTHTPLPFEYYKSNLILYGLGNYYFNQPKPESNFSDFGLGGTISISNTSVHFNPTFIKALRTSLGTFGDYQLGGSLAEQYFSLVQRLLQNGQTESFYQVYAHDFTKNNILPYLSTQAYGLGEMLVAKVDYLRRKSVTLPHAKYLAYLQNLSTNPSHREILGTYYSSDPTPKETSKYHALSEKFQRLKRLIPPGSE